MYKYVTCSDIYIKRIWNALYLGRKKNCFYDKHNIYYFLMYNDFYSFFFGLFFLFCNEQEVNELWYLYFLVNINELWYGHTQIWLCQGEQVCGRNIFLYVILKQVPRGLNWSMIYVFVFRSLDIFFFWYTVP